jgi:AraC-like DNA-binding protein
MLSQNIDAGNAGARVGYESPSQFSREYSRLFGAPPQQDVKRMRSPIAAGSA